MHKRILACLALAACAPGMPRPATRAPVPISEPIESAIALATFDSVWSIVNRSYVDTAFVNARWAAMRDSLTPRVQGVTTREQMLDVLNDLIGGIPDSHFYLIPSSVVGELGSETATSATGTTGIRVRIAGGHAVIWRVEPNSPAALAGLVPGQRVRKIGDRDVNAAIARALAVEDETLRWRALNDLVRRLNGAISGRVGDSVRLELVAPTGGPLVQRTLESVAPSGIVTRFGNLPPMAAHLTSQRIRLPDSAVSGGPAANQAAAACVGVIAFNIWLPALSPALDSAIAAVRDCAGVVIDIRGNPGGLGAMSMALSGYLLDSAYSLGTMKTRQTSLRFVVNPRLVSVGGQRITAYKGPVAVLMDELSASTSEIFAAGLQRLGRARIFGNRSPGQALPSLMGKLPSGDVFVHAIADFTDPEGRRIEGVGVIPDEHVPLTEDDLASGRDAALQAAIAWIVRQCARCH